MKRKSIVSTIIVLILIINTLLPVNVSVTSAREGPDTRVLDVLQVSNVFPILQGENIRLKSEETYFNWESAEVISKYVFENTSTAVASVKMGMQFLNDAGVNEGLKFEKMKVFVDEQSINPTKEYLPMEEGISNPCANYSWLADFNPSQSRTVWVNYKVSNLKTDGFLYNINRSLKWNGNPETTRIIMKVPQELKDRVNTGNIYGTTNNYNKYRDGYFYETHDSKPENIYLSFKEPSYDTSFQIDEGEPNYEYEYEELISQGVDSETAHAKIQQEQIIMQSSNKARKEACIKVAQEIEKAMENTVVIKNKKFGELYKKPFDQWFNDPNLQAWYKFQQMFIDEYNMRNKTKLDITNDSYLIQSGVFESICMAFDMLQGVNMVDIAAKYDQDKYSYVGSTDEIIEEIYVKPIIKEATINVAQEIAGELKNVNDIKEKKYWDLYDKDYEEWFGYPKGDQTMKDRYKNMFVDYYANKTQIQNSRDSIKGLEILNEEIGKATAMAFDIMDGQSINQIKQNDIDKKYDQYMWGNNASFLINKTFIEPRLKNIYTVSDSFNENGIKDDPWSYSPSLSSPATCDIEPKASKILTVNQDTINFLKPDMYLKLKQLKDSDKASLEIVYKNDDPNNIIDKISKDYAQKLKDRLDAAKSGMPDYWIEIKMTESKDFSSYDSPVVLINYTKMAYDQGEYVFKFDEEATSGLRAMLAQTYDNPDYQNYAKANDQNYAIDMLVQFAKIANTPVDNSKDNKSAINKKVIIIATIAGTVIILGGILVYIVIKKRKQKKISINPSEPPQT